MKTINVMIEVPDNWEERLDMQYWIENEIAKDNWSWSFKSIDNTFDSTEFPKQLTQQEIFYYLSKGDVIQARDLFDPKKIILCKFIDGVLNYNRPHLNNIWNISNTNFQDSTRYKLYENI